MLSFWVSVSTQDVAAQARPDMRYVLFRDAEIFLAGSIDVQFEIRVGDKILRHRNVAGSLLPGLFELRALLVLRRRPLPRPPGSCANAPVAAHRKIKTGILRFMEPLIRSACTSMPQGAWSECITNRRPPPRYLTSPRILQSGKVLLEVR